MTDISSPVYGGMFDSTEVVETVGGFPRGNKAVDSAFFAKMIACFYRNGIWGEDSFEAAPGGGMNLTVSPGIAWIRGYMAWQKTAVTLTLSPGTSGSLVLRLNTAAGEFTLEMISGEPEDGASLCDLVLAEITVPAGASAVTAGMIRDTRSDRAKCGLVTSAVDALETVETAQNAVMLGGTPAADYLKATGGVMRGGLRASPDATGQSVVRNIGYGTVMPDSLAEGELFVLISEH